MTKHLLTSQYRIELINKKFSRQKFSCGVTKLDEYLIKYALQDVKRKVSTVFVALEHKTDSVHGFYTLAMTSVLLPDIPDNLAKKLPRYPLIPAILLGRLAVHQEVQNRGVATLLLMDAMNRALENEVAWFAMIVDAKDEKTREFYQKFGFQSFPNMRNKLFMPYRTVADAFS